MTARPVRSVAGAAVPLPGDDIDTDRILPARFVISVPYSELGTCVFADDRRAAGEGAVHPFDRPCFSSARILVTGDNFGCGSSREHAVAALHGWGIEAIVAPSFAGIFEANALANGVVCAVVDPAGCGDLIAAVSEAPDTQVVVDVEGSVVALPSGGRWPFSIAPTSRERLLTGMWDPLEQLLASAPRVAEVADALPYHRWSRVLPNTVVEPAAGERVPVTDAVVDIRYRSERFDDS